GIIGGMAHQHSGSAGVFALTTALAVIWLIAAAGMAQPSYLITRLVPITESKLSDAAGLATKLRQIPGVVEAVIIAAEGVAYLKVDAKPFEAPMAEAVAGSSPALPNPIPLAGEERVRTASACGRPRVFLSGQLLTILRAKVCANLAFIGRCCH